MHPFLHNKFVRFTLFGVGGLFIIFIILIFLSLLNSSTGLNSNLDSARIPSAPMLPQDYSTSKADMYSAEEMEMGAPVSSYYPEPNPTGYTSGLESYETTRYAVSGRIKMFDEFCSSLTALKSSAAIHFKSINQSTNNCRATLYTEEAEAERVLTTLTSFVGIEFVRNTESVTRHRQQIQSRTAILQEQLASVSRSLSMAETQFDELADFARQANDAAALSEALRFKLQNVDNLTERKINLTSQLNNLYQQAADLEERMNVVEFSVNVNRSNPILVGKYEQQWERAWQDLRDAYNDTLIGLSAFFGVFILWIVHAFVYLLVVLVVLRGLWKFGTLLWSKW